MAIDDENWSRRRFLGRVSTAAAAGSVAGCAQIERLLDGRHSAYAPIFFDTRQWAFITAAVDRLIPVGEGGPSGVAANVPAFIDKQMELPYGHGAYWYLQGPFHPQAIATLGYQLPHTPRDIYRVGIDLVNAICQRESQARFAELGPAAQHDVLTAAEHGSGSFKGTLAPVFFAQLLTNAKEGYFADPIHGGNQNMGSWTMIGFPGARADFADWMDQPGKPYPLGPVSITGARPSRS